MTTRSALEKARESYKRIQSYEPEGLSGNERDILALGEHVTRLENILRRHGLNRELPRPTGMPTGARDD